MLRSGIASGASEADRALILSAAGLLIAGIGLLDWRVVRNYSLGFLYLIPILLAAPHLGRGWVLLLAALCTVLREAFSPFALDAEALPRFVMVLVAFSATGLFVGEVTRSQRATAAHLRELNREARKRQAAEEQLELLIESSPAAILTTDADGKIVLANSAAHRLLGFREGGLRGEPIDRYLPLAAGAPPVGETGVSRHMVECMGMRRDGGVFFAQVWRSTYATGSGLRMAAIIYDASEQLRDREEAGLHRLLLSARTVMGAVWHEVRNLCGALGVMHANLKRLPALSGNEDFQALGTLVDGLGRIASRELGPAAEETLENVNLQAVLNEVRIISGPSFEELGARTLWAVPAELPAVRADRHGLLQVFLNLARNAHRALSEAPRRELTVEAWSQDNRVVVRLWNSGPPIPQPDRLFRPFQPGADATGLGLYVSRAIVRSFAGDLRHEPREEGCCFVVDLEKAPAGGGKA